MYEYGTAKSAMINDYDRTGGIAMKAFKGFVRLVRKALGEELKADVQYDFYREQEKALLQAGSFYCPDRMYVK
jgi:hypothetical protein